MDGLVLWVLVNDGKRGVNDWFDVLIEHAETIQVDFLLVNELKSEPLIDTFPPLFARVMASSSLSISSWSFFLIFELVDFFSSHQSYLSYLLILRFKVFLAV